MLKDQSDFITISSETALMSLCYNNPQFLDQKWAKKLVENYAGKRDEYGQTALTRLC